MPPHPAALSDAELARAVDAALDAADEEAPLWDALDAAVDSVGAEAVRQHLLRLAGRDDVEEGLKA